MSNLASTDPTKRQVLINLDDRYVVFGSEGGAPGPIHFHPDDPIPHARAARDGGPLEPRIVETLRVFGMHSEVPEAGDNGVADITLVDQAGRHILIQCKVRESEPKQRDFESGLEHLKQARAEGKNLEVWFLNVERLKLKVMWLAESGLRSHDLVPLNVWEHTANGVFERQRVIDEVDDWVRRVGMLYRDIREWLSGVQRFRFEEARAIAMSEETMQKFAISDRDLQILDVLVDEEVVASFIPRGLWLVDAWGRVDVITKDGTRILKARKAEMGNFEWWISPRDHHVTRRPFDRTVLLQLVDADEQN